MMRVAKLHKPSVVGRKVALVAVAMGALLAIGGGHAGTAGEPVSGRRPLATSCAVGLGTG